MSADNYGLIFPTKTGFGLYMYFASDDLDGKETPENGTLLFSAKTWEEVRDFANQEYFEYGWRDSE